MGEKIASIAGAMIGVATVAVLVQSAYTAQVIKATGDAFSNAMKTSMGQVGR